MTYRSTLIAGLLGVLVMGQAIRSAYAAPRPLERLMKNWLSAVASGDAKKIAACVGEGDKVLFRAKMHPTAPPKQTLDREALEAQLKDGKANQLGLDNKLLLPRVKDLKRKRDGRYEAKSRQCPEVTWIFARKDKRWRLVEVVRTLLEC